MSNQKPPAILQLEQELRIELKELPLSEFENIKHDTSFIQNEQGEVIGLRLMSQNIIDLNFLQHFIQLRKLYLGGNRISDLSPLKHLTMLTWLNLASNQIMDLNPLKLLEQLIQLGLEGNQICDLSPLQHLTRLAELNLTYNQISELNPLQHLVQLTRLYLGGNQISDLSPLRHLVQLTQLSLEQNQINELNQLQCLRQLILLRLWSNRIRELSPLKQLTKLTHLSLEGNQITEVTLDFLNCLPKLTTLRLHGNPIQNIPREIFSGSLDTVLTEVRHYLEGVAKASSQVYQAKIILIGNGRVGKTCLVKRWLDNTFNPAEPSTHAIQLRRHELKTLARAKKFTNIQLNIWDFGGQDIYHATHRLFMKTRALFILVWDAQTEAALSQTESLPGAELTYQNYPLRYWLDYAKYLGDNSPVLIVQTKRDQDGKRAIENWDVLRENYNLIDFLTVESSKEKRNGFQEFKDCLKEHIEKMLESSCTKKLPTAWWQVQQQIQKWQSSKKTISVAKFEQLCEKAELNSAEARTLLQYSHDTGLLFYRKNLFQNQIILDQKWGIEAVYTLFDRNGLFPRLIHTGEFNTRDLQFVWHKFSQVEQKLFLDFMQSCEICFEIDYDREKPFEQRRFLAPALLPDKKPVGLETWQHVESKWFIRYQYHFLHYGNLQSFLGRTHHLATDLWKNGCQLKDEHGNLALVEGFFAREAQYLQVCVTGKNPQVLLDRIRNELEKIQKDDHVTELLSLDGQHFVEREQLTQHPAENPRIQAEDGVWLQYSDFQHFLQKNPHEVFMPAKKAIKIFVSYAHEDREFRELLVAGLERHLSHHSVEYQFWADKDIVLGEMWEKQIKQSLKDTDAALLLVSSYFAASKYINEEEMTTFLKRIRQEKNYLIIPVLVREYNIKPFEKLSALQFFCPYYNDYGFTEPLKAHKMMPFQHLYRETERFGNYAEDYYGKLADKIDKTVSAKLVG